MRDREGSCERERDIAGGWSREGGKKESERGKEQRKKQMLSVVDTLRTFFRVLWLVTMAFYRVIGPYGV